MTWDITHKQDNGIEIEHRVMFDEKAGQFYGAENLHHVFKNYTQYHNFLSTLLVITTGSLQQPNLSWIPIENDK